MEPHWIDLLKDVGIPTLLVLWLLAFMREERKEDRKLLREVLGLKGQSGTDTRRVRKDGPA